MIVVAGPPGSGKSTIFPVGEFGVDFFNIDDRAKDLNGGSYKGIPAALRRQAQQACRDFIASHIENGLSFAVETSLRDGSAIRDAQKAGIAGFETLLIYIATNDPDVNIERIQLRARGSNGHSAPPDVIRKSYQDSLSYLSEAVKTFDYALVHDNTQNALLNDARRPRLLLHFEHGTVTGTFPPLLPWVTRAGIP